jgi:outer membrane receptor protein involved in Fe transport
MRSFTRFVTMSAVLLLVATMAMAQATMGSLTGTVTHEGAPLPGVTVTATSPALQGTRVTVSNENGNYSFPALPPGEYTVVFNMSGMTTVTRVARVPLGGTARADASLRLTGLAEAITVTAGAPAALETTEIQTNFSADLISDLPVGRTLIATTSLAPGVVNGVNGLAISGANSYDNLWTVNGAIVNEGIRGQPHNLFIEDAIQETTIQTGAISAEYGYFTGGVINAITRSGGNEFSGSFRDSFTNPAWTADSDFRNPTTGAAPPAPISILNEVYEATLGGRILRDRLWFFGAGRYFENTFENNFSNSERKFTRVNLDERFEGKLTGALTPSHSLVGSYLEAPVTQTNECTGALGVNACFDESAIVPQRSLPNDFKSAQYNGIFGQNLLLEARWSEKTFAFVNSGGLDPNRATGTPVRLVAPGFASHTNEGYFCGSCGPERRDNEHFALKGNYFLSTGALGTHNIAVGAERFHETRLSNNYQSPTNYVAFLRTFAPTRDANQNTLISVGNNDILLYYPILKLSEGSDLNTNGYFINNKWDVNRNLTLQLGARYDQNDSADSAGNPTASDAKFSPRLGVAYDLFGNGRLRLNASLGTYVNRLSEGVSGVAGGGSPATFQYLYGGAPITNLPPHEAMALVFAWFDSVGGPAGLNNIPCTSAQPTGCLLAQSIPGFNARLEDRLVSPSVDEWTIGAGTQIGTGGYLRADYINRSWQDFYTTKANLGIGSVTSPTGARADLFLTSNSNDFRRDYDAIQLQGQYRLLRRVNIGATYTWSELKGNIVGETTGNGPVSVGGDEFYPEYYNFEQNRPYGLLSQDQTHRARVWAGIDIPTFIGNFNVSALQRFESGTPYQLSGLINPTFANNFYGIGDTGRTPGGIVNPGYISAQTSVAYFFSERGEFRFDDLMATDLALNYTTSFNRFRGLQLFISANMLNLFNEQAALSHDTSILTAANNAASCNTAAANPATCMQRFNPMAGDVPVEGIHWRRGPNFGKPTNQNQLQQARTYSFSTGIRF